MNILQIGLYRAGTARILEEVSSSNNACGDTSIEGIGALIPRFVSMKQEQKIAPLVLEAASSLEVQ